MKTFAVIPALFVLISLCGSPVPPPPGTVSGMVFFDANRNGIRDTCDSPMRNTQVVVNGPEGATGSARTTDRGEFTIEDAPVGDGAVTLFTDANHLWPITTAPQAVHVQSSKEVAGVVIGSASRAVYDANIMSISGVIFDDRNANGEVDLDECGISRSNVGFDVRSGDRRAVVGAGGAYELKNLPGGRPPEVTAGYSSNEFGLSYDPFGASALPLEPTDGRPGGEPCTTLVRARPRYGPLVFEANIGFRLARNDGSVSGVVFNDRDGDGELDDGEPPVADVSVRLLASSGCVASGKDWMAITDEDGRYHISGLYLGEYTVSLDTYQIDETNFVTLSVVPGVTLSTGEPARLDVPVKIAPGGSVRAAVFDDNNGDGVWGPGESAGEGIVVCVYPEPPLDLYGPKGYGKCARAGSDGVALVSPVPEGVYSVSVSGPLFGNVAYPEPLTTTVTSGQETSLVYPLDLVQPEEQVIPPGEGTPLELNGCYSDPTWVQPTFTAGTYPEIPYGFSEEMQRLIFGHHVYSAVGPENSVWVRLAGLDWFSGVPAGCENPRMFSVFNLVTYEPLDATRSGDVVQVRLGRRQGGLYTAHVPVAETSVWFLFVDENYEPIVRCSNQSGCEWNDGTSSTYGGGAY